MRQTDGRPLRDHLTFGAQRGSETARAALVPPAYARRYGYLFDWFYELHGRRGASVNGAAALTWPDIDAWARRTQREPSPWELRVLGLIDDAFFAAQHPPKRSATDNAKPAPSAWPTKPVPA